MNNNKTGFIDIEKRKYRFDDNQPPFEVAHRNEQAKNMQIFHWHEFFEISYICKGIGVYYIEDKCIPVKEGDIIIINDIERHRVEYQHDEPLYETVLHFTPSFLDSISKTAGKLFDYNTVAFSNKLIVDYEIREQLLLIITLIVDEYELKKPFYELHIIGLISNFIALTLRHNKAPMYTVVKSSYKTTNSARLEQILKYLSANLSSNISLRSVSAHFYLNPTYFSEYFKKNLGVKFNEYVRELRILYAIQLLESKKMSITEVAYACGFSTLSAFYSSFSAVTGNSPKKYIKQNAQLYT